MLVYSNAIWLDESAGVDSALDAIAEWLSRKTRQSVKPWRLKEQTDLSMKDGSHIQSWAAVGEFPVLHALRYTHRDSRVGGRQWVTEIGMRLPDASSPIQCTVQLRTNEISARVSAKVEVTRPLVIQEILKRCRASQFTPGLSTKNLTLDSGEAFRDLVNDENRKCALVVISPKDGSFLVDPKRVLSLVIGLAEVYVIPPDVDTFALAEVVGRQYAAWLGAVNVILPRFQYKSGDAIPTRRLMPDDLERLASLAVRPDAEILSILAHRFNLPNSWNHISPDIVREHILRQELHRQREEAQKTGTTRGLR